MRLLVDTHIFLWAYSEPEKLTEDAQRLLGNPSIEKLFSAASAWEIGIKWAKGGLYLSEPPVTLIPNKVGEAGLIPFPITLEDALIASELPQYHGDPFDRMLVAQAQRSGARILTNDKTLAKYDVDLIALWLRETDDE
jgi:PIN domain nuclease of toxin-antitoxin system